MHVLPNPILCAIDTPDIERAQHICAGVKGLVGGIKLGLEFFTANGAAGVASLAQSQLPVFLDLKFHDIPTTVARAIAATAGIPTFMMTVHTAGGRAMLRAAIDASMDVASLTGKERPLIVGVTVLTSLDQDDLAMLGFKDKLDEQVLRLTDLALSAGLDGVVCSPHEIHSLRKRFGSDLTLVTPGIRPAGSERGDQKRTMTPQEAMERGADYLVIGRPLTEAQNIQAMARQLRLDVTKAE